MGLEEIKTPLEENTFDGVVKQKWYQDFVKGVDQPMLFDLVTAANFMAIQPLLDLTCLQVSCSSWERVQKRFALSSTSLSLLPRRKRRHGRNIDGSSMINS